ncbi:uncharacterized protein [Salminus brasiliensis]|uniref:uncharacterized protein n=1 Tax=Salminus brasiliensis TaxID=930266 RepID=UPI003B82D903
MDGSESSMNRLGRTIWTVWGYLSGAVGRYLRPEVSNEDKRNAEDAAADVTVSKSYRELKENEEEKERSETKACDQGVSPQTGIRVRAAAVQWEKASVRKSGTSRQAGTGTGVVVEGIDQKAQEQKRGEKTSENNNEAVGARSRDFAEEAFVDAPASIEANTGGQDFGISRSERVERVIDGVAKKESAEKAAVSSENAGQDVELEELTNERGRESLAKVSEEKVVKDAEDQDGNEESEEEQGKWGTTEGQDETCASPMADDVLSQLTYSTREREDLLKAPSNKDLKVDEKHQEETTEAKAERELIGAGDEETKQGTQGAIKDGQHEEGQQLRESIQDVEVQDIYKFELEKAQTEVGEGRAVAVTCKPGTTQVEKAEMSEEESEPDGHHEAGQLNICESGHQDEPQLGFTEEVVGIVEIVEIGKAPEPISTGTENEVTPTPERDPNKATEEAKQVAVRTVKEGQYEAEIDLTESKLVEAELVESRCEKEVWETEPEPIPPTTEREVIDLIEESMQVTLETIEGEQQLNESKFAETVDLGESKLDESPTEFTEQIAKMEHEPLEEPGTGQVENADIWINEPEPVGKSTENEAAPEPVCVTKETRQVTLETIEDDQHEVSQQWGETKFAESVDLCKLVTPSDSKFPETVDEHPTEFTEEGAMTERDLLEEPVAEHMEVVEVHEEDLEPSSKGTENEEASTPETDPVNVAEEDEKHEAKQQFREPTFAESESKPNESRTEFTEEDATTECDLLEEPVTGRMEGAEVCEEDLEPISEGIENEAALTPEKESFSVLEESKQVIEETIEDEQHEISQELSDSKFEATENEAAPEPVCVTKETRQVTLETIEDEQHEVSQQWSESRFAEIVDLCKSELDEHPTAFTEGRVKTECGLLEEPMTGRMDVVEVYEEDLEPSSKTIENEAALTPEKESISVLEQSKQVTEGTIEDEQHEISQESSDSKFPETVDEHPTEFTEEGAKTERDLLEEPVAEHMEVVEVHEEDLEPSSKGTENEEASTPETDPISVAEEDEKHEAKQQFCEPTFAESESKPNESRTEFTEEDATTECDLLEEPVMGRMEGAEVCEEDLEPISEGIENEAALTPEKESFSVLEESKQVIEETIEDEQHEISQELSDSKFAETVDLCESEPKETLTEGRTTAERNLLEEPAGEQMEKDLELSSKGTENEAALVLDSEASDVLNEATAQEIVVALKSGLQEVDQQLCEQFIGEKLDLLGPKLREPRSGFTEEMVEPEYEPSSTTELGSSEAALKTKVEQLDDTVCDLVIPEVAIKQDRESVIALAAEEPGNQSETAEFQQEVRAEVAADVVKKPAELERRLHELPIAREQLALQETMGQSTLAQGSLQEIAFDGNGNELGSAEEQLSSMQRETREIESGSAEQAVETANESVDVMPSSSPQELDKSGDSIATSVDVVTGLTAEVEVLEACTELTAVSGHVVTEEKCEKAESETDALKEDSESTLTTGETSETIRRSEASILDDASGSQGLLSQGEWTVRDRSAVEPHGHQMGYSGELSLPESEPALDGRMQKDSGKGCKDVESPDEAEVGLLEDMDEKVRTASLGVVEGIMRGLKQEFEERPSLLTRDADEKKGWTKTKGEYLEPSESSSAFLQVQCEFSDGTVKDRQNVQVEAMDVGHDEDCLKMESVDLGGYEDKKAGGEKLVVDRNANVQKISRPGLKRGFEKLAKDEVDKPPLSKEWAGKIVLQQVSALDCTVQKSKIAVKNPLVRPPKDPRTLINKASVEPLAPTRPSQPSPLRKVQAEGISVPQKGVIGFKLPGLGAGFPALKKTDAGRKIREEGDAESVSTQSPPDQKSDTETEPKEDSVKQEQPVNKPKWTPPRHPGMGNPLMMSELKSKLKKTGKE